MTFQQYISTASKLSEFKSFDVQPVAGAFEVCLDYKGSRRTFLLYTSTEIVDAMNAKSLYERLRQAEPKLFTTE